MSTASETLNLATLHPDIIRRITRFDEHYDIQIVLIARLISRSWNTVVLEYLSNRRNLPEIELVQIPGTDTWPDFLEPVVRFIEGTRVLVTIPQNSMYANGIGMDRWSEIMYSSEKDKIVETSSFKYPIPLPSGEDKPFYAAIVAAIGGFWYWCGGLSLLAVGGTVMLPILMLIGLCYYKFYRREMTVASRLNRTFQRFSQIKRLQLCDLEKHTLSIVEKRISDIIIMSLEANALKFGEPAKSNKSIQRTVALCRKHAVRHVCLYLRETVEYTYFRKLVIELIKIGVKLDVFDCQYSDPQPWLGHHRIWWNDLANDLSALEISLRMITKVDPTFSMYYAQSVHTAGDFFLPCIHGQKGVAVSLGQIAIICFPMLVNNDEVNLATLPPDIIHHIVRCDSPSTNKMRLISHSWNAVVLEFLSNRRNLPSLERVFLSRGPFREESKCDYVNQLRMYALVPEKYMDRVGAGLVVHDDPNKLEDIVEVCNPLSPMKMKFKISMLDVIAAMFSYFPHEFYDVPYIYSCVIHFTYMIISYFLCEKNMESLCEYDMRPKFIRFFQSFSHIETVVLDNMMERILNNVENIFGDIRIDQLEIRRASFDNSLGGRILKMCRKNAVRMVLISICKFKDDFDFGQFVIDLAQLGVQLDLYDIERRNTQLVFGQGQEWWAKMDAKMIEANITCRERILLNGLIPNSVNGYVVKGHMQFTRKSDTKCYEPLNSVHKTRGFYSYHCF